MKINSFRFIRVLLLTALVGIAAAACQKGKEGEGDQALAIKVFAPTKVIPGQVVSISGVGLENVTSVVFPGGVAVSKFEVIGSGLINVVTPEGIAASGALTVEAGDKSASSRAPMTLGAPKFRTLTYPASDGGPGAWITTELLITGADLEFVEQVKFPGQGGDVVVNAIDFVRKANNMIKVKVPAGITEGDAKIKLVTCSGEILETSVVLLIADVAGFKGPLEGDWVWSSGSAFGNGGYLANDGPAWWKVGVGEGLDGVSPTAGEGLKKSFMTFTRKELTKTRADGTTVTGTYELDMTVSKRTSNDTADWSIGQLRTSEVSVLVGIGPGDDKPEVFVYDILSITDTRMVLAYAPEGTGAWGTAHFWVFERKGASSSSYPVDATLSFGQSVTLEGIDDIAEWWIDPDFFTRVEGSNNEFTFNAAAGSYRINADKGLKYFTVEVLSGGELATTQPDGSGAVWIIGAGIGKPSSANDIGWTPEKALCMAPIGDKKYRVTLVAGTHIGTDAINFKFFHQKGWGDEFKSGSYSGFSSELIKLGAAPDDGNLLLADGVTLEEGKAYEFILDLSGGASAAKLSVTAKD